MKLLRQKLTNAIYVWTPKLANLPEMEEFSGAVEDHIGVPIEAIPKIKSETIEFYLSADGMGDSVCGLYAACGIANAGHNVVFYTKQYEILKAHHPRLKILPLQDSFDANKNYRNQLKSDIESRALWYIKNIAQAYSFKECLPSRPDKVDFTKSIVDGDYVLLAPFANHDSRNWHHYRRLALKLTASGKRVVAVAIEKHRKKLEDLLWGTDVERFINTDSETLISLVSNAEYIVANDSGISHLGGLYNTKTIALVSQFDPKYLFECGESITSIEPVGDCVQCHTIPENGWDQNCNQYCSALQTISTEQVAAQIIQPDIKKMAKAVLLKRQPKTKTTE
jgi:ADP-heptose:LPS heptosyltransferase